MLKEETNYKNIGNSYNFTGVNIIWNPVISKFIIEDTIIDIVENYNTEEPNLSSFISCIYDEDKEKMIGLFYKDLEKVYENNEELEQKYRIKTTKEGIVELIFIGKVIKHNGDYCLIGTNYLYLQFNEQYESVKQWNLKCKKLLVNKKMSSIMECDRITGLPNSYYFKNMVSKFLKNIVKNNTRAAIMVVDLDNFKYVNDSFGHDFGDLLLKEVSNNLVYAITDDAMICRYSGNTFLIFITNIKNKKDILSISKDVSKILDKPSLVGNNKIYLSASIGIALFPEHGLDYTTLFKNADAAMYEAKKSGKKECKFFDNSFAYEVNRVYRLQKGLRTALEKNEIYVVFQPKVSLYNSLVNGFEALARWKSEEFGDVSPQEFIPIAENSKMIVPIGSFVLEEVFRKIRFLLSEGKDNFKIAVNLSEIQLREDVVLYDFRRLIKKYRISPKYIEVEITESMLMKSFDKNLKILEEIKSLGVSIALDDFGTGYSSLNYLTRLPIDVLKIDRSFVIDLVNNPKSKCIVENIINLSHQLGIEVVAEGVEDKSQVDYLREILCDVVQGYYFSKPRMFNQIVNIIGKKI